MKVLKWAAMTLGGLVALGAMLYVAGFVPARGARGHQHGSIAPAGGLGLARGSRAGGICLVVAHGIGDGAVARQGWTRGMAPAPDHRGYADGSD